MTHSFEEEKNKKALLYTIIICFLLSILFFIIRWNSIPPPDFITQDLIEINLGNNMEGIGEVQPLVSGNKTIDENIPAVIPQKKIEEQITQPTADDNAEKDAAPVLTAKKKQSAVEEKIIPKKPALIYTGANKGKNGNNPTDNGYKYQGDNPKSNGDNNDPNGNKDSYGNTPGGKIGGPRVTKGNRKIIQHYKFEGDLNKATIYAIIKVSPEGIGNFVGFDKGSTDRTSAYAAAISKYLNRIQFNKTNTASTVTVEFIFNIN